MNILLSQYQIDERVDVRHRYNPKELDLEFVDLKYLDTLQMEGTVEKGRDTLTFQGHLSSKVEHTCARCLKSIPDVLDESFQLFYDIRGRDEIDTTNDLREVLILNHDISFLCREDCRGLCPQCGANLNEAQCQCEKSVQKKEESPFKAMLKKIKEGKRNGTS